MVVFSDLKFLRLVLRELTLIAHLDRPTNSVAASCLLATLWSCGTKENWRSVCRCPADILLYGYQEHRSFLETEYACCVFCFLLVSAASLKCITYGQSPSHKWMNLQPTNYGSRLLWHALRKVPTVNNIDAKIRNTDKPCRFNGEILRAPLGRSENTLDTLVEVFQNSWELGAQTSASNRFFFRIHSLPILWLHFEHCCAPKVSASLHFEVFPRKTWPMFLLQFQNHFCALHKHQYFYFDLIFPSDEWRGTWKPCCIIQQNSES